MQKEFWRYINAPGRYRCPKWVHPQGIFSEISLEFHLNLVQNNCFDTYCCVCLTNPAWRSKPSSKQPLGLSLFVML